MEFFSSRFEFTNPDLIDEDGLIPRHTVSLRLDRTVSGGVHEDYDIINYSRRPIRITLEIAITSDFADIFDVKARRLVRRGEINTQWSSARRSLRTTYRNRTFRRDLLIQIDKADSRPQFANGRLIFVATIEPKGVWHTCLRWIPLTQSGRYPPTLDCSALTTRPQAIAPPLPGVGIDAPNETVVHTWRRSVRDMEALRLEDPQFERGVYIPAAGVPWFVTLFGRDSLVVSMQGISGFPEFAAGALRRLSNLQATEDDPERDMEPGKIPHEIRHGELAQLGILPFTPYYGTHDATSLFVIVLSYLYQWLGDVEVLDRYLPNAEAAMAWIDTLRRPRRRWVPGVPDPIEPRLLQPGLEGRRRRDPRRGRVARSAPDRTCRAAGLRVRREAAAGRHLRDARPARGRGAAARRGAAPLRALQQRLLVGERGDVLPRSRRRASSRSSPSPRTRGTAWPAASFRPIAPGASSSG